MVTKLLELHAHTDVIDRVRLVNDALNYSITFVPWPCTPDVWCIMYFVRVMQDCRHSLQWCMIVNYSIMRCILSDIHFKASSLHCPSPSSPSSLSSPSSSPGPHFSG